MQPIHTAGPWEVRRIESATPQLAICIEGAAKSTGRIATVPLRDGFHLRNAADALLIAAAPDLLAVVLELEESAAYWSEYFVPLGIVDRLRAAINKAIGNQEETAP